jgi:hypothetical protein
MVLERGARISMHWVKRGGWIEKGIEDCCLFELSEKEEGRNKGAEKARECGPTSILRLVGCSGWC